jgi:hypothetical protein
MMVRRELGNVLDVNERRVRIARIARQGNGGCSAEL